jgi:hypothetical protein
MCTSAAGYRDNDIRPAWSKSYVLGTQMGYTRSAEGLAMFHHFEVDNQLETDLLGGEIALGAPNLEMMFRIGRIC